VNRPLRIAIVAPSLAILGGQSVQAEQLLRAWSDDPDVQAWLVPVNPEPPSPRLRSLARKKYIRTLITQASYWPLLWRELRRADVVHVFSASYTSYLLATMPAMVVAGRLGLPVLLNYHSGEAEDHLKRWRRTAIPTLRLVDSIVVPSEYLVRVFAEFGLRAHAIYNLIDTERFRFRDRIPLRPVFLSNRNLESHYGVDRVLRAFSIIQGKIPEARLTIVGDGSQRRSLQTLAQELNLKTITFVGQVEPAAIADVYDAADIYLNGSEIDNQPLSILEAFSCGLPIVTTDAGGIPEMVKGGTGMVVPRGDYAGMAERAISLLSDPELAKQMIEQGRLECLKYSWQAVREAWLNTYHALRKESKGVAADEAERKAQPTSESKILTR
jgi:glycosyltransferase involved in cell wall biosynthesis